MIKLKSYPLNVLSCFIFVCIFLSACNSTSAPPVEANLVIAVSPTMAEVAVDGFGPVEQLNEVIDNDTLEIEYNVEPGTLTINAEAEGYEPFSEQYFIRGLSTFSLNIFLAEDGKGVSVAKSLEVNAGNKQTLTFPDVASLKATVNTQGISETVNVSWSKVSGPGEVSFTSSSMLETTATFSKAGSYTLALAASAEGLVAKDEVEILVEDKPSNAPPPPSPPPAPEPEPPVIEKNAYYVATTGSDKQVGSFEKPFRSIQKCASVVKAGESCIMRKGTYRETIAPANDGRAGSPITFKAYPGESVTINGTETLPNSGWSKHSGNIYKIAMGWDLGDGNNQVFLNRQMMMEARWPNVSLDVSRPTWARSTRMSGSKSNVQLSDSNIKKSYGGAYINVGIGGLNAHAWITQTGRVNSSSSGTLNFSSLEQPFFYQPVTDNPYFLWGKLDLLDSAGEWFYKDGTLYLWTPKGDNPKNYTLEVKKRQHAFNLKGRRHITLKNLKLFANTVISDANSEAIVIDGLDAKYLSHFMKISKNPWSAGSGTSGIILHGTNHVLRNSVLRYSAGNGVTLHGKNHLVENNIIRDTVYSGTDTAAVTMSCINCSGSSNEHKVLNNTLYDSGRSILLHRKTGKSKILYNHMYNAGLQMEDVGVTYTYQTDGQRTEIAYNLIHDNHARNLGLGIYFDHESHNHFIHHNVIWNVTDALRFNIPSNDNRVFNNTLLSSRYAVNFWGASKHAKDLRGLQIHNSIANKPIRIDHGAVQSHNVILDNPGFVNWSSGNFQLNPSSPVIDQGRILDPYTNGYIGKAPDLGAYEFGKSIWKAGSNLKQ